MRCDWDSIAWVDVIHGYRAKFIHTETATLSLWQITAGTALPPHAHLHEQITQLIEGAFDLTVDGHEYVMKPGDVVFIPPHAAHSAMPQTDCLVLDIFHPRREDYVAANFAKLGG